MKAFPINNGAFEDELGMDLRDYFAAKALQSLLWNPDAHLDSKEDVAIAAYEYADMMMEIRSMEIST
jgi:hypothetical protein